MQASFCSCSIAAFPLSFSVFCFCLHSSPFLPVCQPFAWCKRFSSLTLACTRLHSPAKREKRGCFTSVAQSRCKYCPIALQLLPDYDASIARLHSNCCPITVLLGNSCHPSPSIHLAHRSSAVVQASAGAVTSLGANTDAYTQMYSTGEHTERGAQREKAGCGKTQRGETHKRKRIDNRAGIAGMKIIPRAMLQTGL